MKKLLISFLLFLLLSPLFAGADVVVFKDGKRIETKGTWKENEQIKCYYRGGIVGFPEELIERIEKVEVEKKVEKKKVKKQRRTTRTSSNNMVDASSIESEIKEFARNKYPNNQKNAIENLQRELNQQRVKESCSSCNGTGKVEGWRWGKEFVMHDSYGNPIYKQVQIPTPKTCPVCNGTGGY